MGVQDVALPGLEDPMIRIRELGDEMMGQLETYTRVNHPVYVQSRHRAGVVKTTPILDAAGVQYRLVVEPHDIDAYREHYHDDQLLELPDNDRGLWFARQWIRDHAQASGAEYHWQIDDNIMDYFRRPRGSTKAEKLPVNHSLSYLEALVGHFTNIGGANFQAQAFAFSYANGPTSVRVNMISSCCILYRSAGDVAARFQNGTAEDTDYTLQMLREGWCTLTSTRLTYQKVATGAIPGGCWDVDYVDDGRLRRFEKLCADWPGAFKIIKVHPRSRGGIALAPSRIWRSFPQRPIWKET